MRTRPSSLPRHHALTLAFSLALVAGACSLSSPGGGGVTFGSIAGRVTDTAGNPLTGVSIRVPGGPATTSGVDGAFRLAQVRPHARVAVDFAAPGFGGNLKTMPVLPGGETRQDVVLAQARVISFAASAGATLPLPSGARVRIPANSLVRADGSSATGNVSASVAFIDPRDPAQIVAAPGELTVGSGAERVPLTSGGMVRVEVRDASGAALALAPGRAAELEVPQELLTPARAPGIRDTSSTRPDTIPQTSVYLFDTGSGQWVWVDTAKVAPGSTFITATMPSLGNWFNVDYPETRTCVAVRVTTPGGAPRPNTYVISYGLDYNGYSYAYTGPDGRATLLTRRSSVVRLNSGGQSTDVNTPGTEVPCADAGTLSF